MDFVEETIMNIPSGIMPYLLGQYKNMHVRLKDLSAQGIKRILRISLCKGKMECPLSKRKQREYHIFNNLKYKWQENL